MNDDRIGDYKKVDLPIQIAEWESLAVEVRWHEPDPPLVLLTHVYQHPEPDHRRRESVYLPPAELDKLIEALRTARDLTTADWPSEADILGKAQVAAEREEA